LVAATAVWGSTFVVTKGSLDQLAPASFLVWRFGIAALALLLARPRAVTRLAPAEWRHAAVLGAALSAGFLLQTNGLRSTPAGVSGFLTGAAVVLTPVVAGVVFREQVGLFGWVAVAASAVGISALTGGTGAPPATGAVLTLGGAACFAVHIAGLSRWSTPHTAYALTAASVAVAAAVCLGAALVGRDLGVPATAGGWTAVLYLGLLATCVGFAVQAWAQSALSATTAAVTMTMEPVFAAVIAAVLGERPLGLPGWFGGALVVAGMGVAELGQRRCCDALSPRVECC
jgi:drug/metabolite transporter (DMT)-like permease